MSHHATLYSIARTCVWHYPTFFECQAVLLVCLSNLGFYLDPDATPARVALGMLAVLVVLGSYITLDSGVCALVSPQNVCPSFVDPTADPSGCTLMLAALPKTSRPPWLYRFLLVSLCVVFHPFHA